MVKNTQGEEVTYLVEIKPDKETRPPTTKNKKRFLVESKTFAKNMSKWTAAKNYCQLRGWQFKIITEYELGIKKR